MEPQLKDSRVLSAVVLSDESGLSLQVALSLGELTASLTATPRKVEKLAAIAVQHSEDAWIRCGVLCSAADCGMELLVAITKAPAYAISYPRVEKFVPLISEVNEVIGAAGDEREIMSALSLAAPAWKSDDRGAAAALSLATVNGLGRGVVQRGGSLRRILDTFNRHERPEWDRMGQFFDSATSLAAREAADRDLRCEAISALQHTRFDRARPVLLKLIQADPLQEIRLAAVDALGAFDDANVAGTLVSVLPAQTPSVRRRVLQSLLRTTPRAEALLAEIEVGRLSVTELDPTHVQSLVNHKEATVRDQARKLLAAAIPAERKLVLEKYQPALALKGDTTRGRGVFEKNCITCHKIGELGVNVAPDISDSRTKTPAQLLNDILNPNQAIDNNFVSYTVLTKDGKSETGIVATETAASITLRQPEGKTVLILRQEIDELKSNGISLMPEGLEKNITVDQMADLIAFIKNWRYLDGAIPLEK
jgi:putative heme-binding domain-containing protein